MYDPGKFEALLDHTTNAMLVVDERSVCSYANAAVERCLGYSPSELVGSRLLEYVHPDDGALAAALEALGDDGTDATTAEFRLRDRDGDWRWFESRVAIPGDAPVDGYVVSAREITERKRAIERQERIERRFEQLSENTNDVLWMFTGDWSEMLFINSAYEDIWGLSVDDLRDDPSHFLEAVHPDDRRKVADAMERLSTGGSVDFEFRVVPEEPYQRWVWIQAEPIIKDGEVTRIVGFTRDITHRRRREQQLHVMDHLLRHNLRNDMNIILGQARYAAEQGDETVASCAETIVETGEQLLETAEKERDVVSVLTGGSSSRDFDVVERVYEAVERVRSEHPSADIEVDTPPSASVSALPKIRIAIQELLENAIVHAEDDVPAVEIAVRPGDQEVRLVIEDDAPPIPEYEYETITGTHEIGDLYHGSGIGLWLVYWIVELSDGDVAFDTSGSSGNTITIALPRPE